MAVSFEPSLDAIPVLPWNITYLSQRDVTLPLPINYLTAPGIFLTPACFAHNYYEDNTTAQCLSNLLSIGYRRLVVDLYWNPERSVWGLCPVQVPTSNMTKSASRTIMSSTSTGNPSSSADSSYRPSFGSTLASGTSLAAVQARIPHTQWSDTYPMAVAQPSTTLRPSKTTITLSPTISGNSTLIILPSSVSGDANETLYSIGPYTCTSSVDINTLITIVREFVAITDNNLQADFKYLIFNLHAAASAFNPLSPAPAPRASSLPDNANLIGNIVGNTLASSLYTPQLLEQQRMNLNASWLDSQITILPLESYFSVERGTGKTFFSPDGWPDSNFLELGNQRRLLLAFGSVDPQMATYNFSADNDMVFAQGYTQDFINVTMSANGTVIRGCIFEPETASLSVVNASWAETSDILSSTLPGRDETSYNSSLPSISNLTACGITPMLNQTLGNVTADQDIRPYRQFVYSSIWSWAYGQPASDNDNNDSRCAVFDPAQEGRWRAVPCDQKHRAACQAQNAPHVWMISSSSGPYGSPTELSCPKNYTFATPRTGLENRYLLEAFRRSGLAEDNSLWINFNSLDVESCWVVGVTSSCPYSSDEDVIELITVPTISAVIILIIAGLLILVKCGANRSNSRRSRRGQDGWDYEGVPS